MTRAQAAIMSLTLIALRGHNQFGPVEITTRDIDDILVVIGEAEKVPVLMEWVEYLEKQLKEVQE